MTKNTDETAVVAAIPADQKKPQFATVPLDEPIVRGATTITTLTLRRPNSGSLRGLNLNDIVQMNVNALQKLLPRISDPTLTEADVANMDPADLTSCGVEVVSFLVPRREKESFQ